MLRIFEQPDGTGCMLNQKIHGFRHRPTLPLTCYWTFPQSVLIPHDISAVVTAMRARFAEARNHPETSKCYLQTALAKAAKTAARLASASMMVLINVHWHVINQVSYSPTSLQSLRTGHGGLG